MKTLPRSDRREKTGTNIRGDAPGAYRAGIFKRQLRPLVRLANDYRRAVRKLLSRSDLRAAAAIVERLRHEYHATSLKLGPDATAWKVSRAKFHRRARRELTRALPDFRGWLTLARAFQRDHRKLTAVQASRVNAGAVRIDLGEVALPDEGTTQEFLAPFPVHDVSINDFSNYPDLTDESFAIPGIGHVVNNLELEYDDDTSILNGIFGLYLPVYGWSRAGCGINYTVPRAGRLRIGGALQNFHTRVKMSLADNFGFSMGTVYASVNLYVEIVRGRNITTLSQTLIKESLESDGDGTSTTLPSLDDTTPYSIDVTTDEVFEAGAAVQILAGSEFVSGCVLDDMRANVTALLWSQVKKITVDVV